MRLHLLAILYLTQLTTACAFGTNYVRLRPTVTTPLPNGGRDVAVEVKDSRPDLSGTQVGFKRNGYGAKTGSVELGGGITLSNSLANDTVVLLRQGGYRAKSVSEDLSRPASVVVKEDIVSFVVDNKMGMWSGAVEGVAVVRVDLEETAGRQSWSDVVRAYAKKEGLQFASESDQQEVVSDLYRNLLSSLAAQLLPVLASRSNQAGTGAVVQSTDATPPSAEARLGELRDLFEKGLISPEEYKTKRAKIMQGL
jgi:uncharacterized lipoprotein YajG